MEEFKAFPKMGRLFRECLISEKIDGTNAQVLVAETGEVLAGSRTRWITPEDDNFGFAAWVKAHEEELRTLGPGHHFGEWWGQGIQRNYGLTEKRFSLFNVTRWCLHGQKPGIWKLGPRGEEYFQKPLPPCCGLVPVLYRGVFDTQAVRCALNDLQSGGSAAAPGFMKPEGVVVFHTAANVMFKATLENDGLPKSLVKGTE